MKSKEEIADGKEEEIKTNTEVQWRAAQLEFSEATKAAWEEYESIWGPAKEKWEAFSQPYFKILQDKLVMIDKAEGEALAEVRRDWQKCPRCGEYASRYQVHCDKCRTNLLTEKTETENADI